MNKLKRKIIEWLGGTVQITSHDKVKIVHRTYSTVPIKVGINIPVDTLFSEEEADELAKEELTQRLVEHIVENNLLTVTKEKNSYPPNSYNYYGTLYVVMRK